MVLMCFMVLPSFKFNNGVSGQKARPSSSVLYTKTSRRATGKGPECPIPVCPGPQAPFSRLFCLQAAVLFQAARGVFPGAPSFTGSAFLPKIRPHSAPIAQPINRSNSMVSARPRVFVTIMETTRLNAM